MASGKKNILIVAGEASGDLHGSKVVEAIRELNPQVRVVGMGGNHLRRAGTEILIDSSHLAVVGITEVLGRLGDLIRAYRKLKDLIRSQEIGLLILIDFPDFNLGLAGIAKDAGVPVLYYISPQVWAWRSGRVQKIVRRVSRMAVIFPFEVALYEEAGLKAEFVGHPLMDTLGQTEDLSPSQEEGWNGNPLIALLPGSRHKEVKALLPEMARAAQIMTQKWSEVGFLLALAPTIARRDAEEMLPSSGIRVQVVEGMTYQAIRAADLVWVASGTATLETAILGKPMVIAYQVSPLSYWVGRAMIRVGWIGLANIVAGRTVVPELIQKEARGERIAEETQKILEDEPYRRGMIEGLAEVKQKLGSPGAAERVARMALEMIEK